MVLAKKIKVFLEELVVVTASLTQIFYGLILTALLIHMLNDQILKIVFHFWQVPKHERSSFSDINLMIN